MKPESIAALSTLLTDVIKNGLVNYGLAAAKEFVCVQLSVAIAARLPIDQVSSCLIVEAEQHYDRDLKPTVNKFLGQLANGLDFDHGVCSRMVRQVWMTRWVMCHCPDMMAKSLYTILYINGTFNEETVKTLGNMGAICDLETTEHLYQYRANGDITGGNSVRNYVSSIFGLVGSAMAD